MKTNGFPKLFLPRTSKSLENEWFSNTFPFLELQKAMKTYGFPILFLTRASMKTAPKASKELPRPENGPDVYRAHIAF